MLFKGSRYETTPRREYTHPDGRTVRYLGLRIIPDTPAPLGHVVDEGERLDHIAARRLGDPERFWRICDANRAVRPEDLLEAGRRLALPGQGG